MDTELFLQHLREVPLEEGRAFLQQQSKELPDPKAIGELLAKEARRVLYTPLLSLKIAELLIFYGEQITHPYSRALGLKAKGDALTQIGHYQAAMDALDASGAEFLQLGDEVNWARSRISWILACGWQGDTKRALEVAADAREVFLRQGETYWACVIDNNTAIILGNTGQNEEAVKLYERMLAIYPTVTDQSEAFIQRSIAIAQKNQANRLAWLGEFEQVYYLQQQALATLNKLNETGLVVQVEMNLANLDYVQGYYGSALRRYYQAREKLMQHDPDNTLLLAGLQTSIAGCLVKLDRLQEACLVSEEGIEAYRKVGLSQSINTALHQHALTLMASGKLKEAFTILDEAWDLFNNGGFKPLAYFAKLQQAEISLMMGATTTAYDLAHVAKDYFDTQNLIECSTSANLVMVGTLVEDIQKNQLAQEEQLASALSEAIHLCQETMVQACQHNLQEAIYKGHYLMGHIFALQHDFVRAARHYQAAIAQIERMLDNLVHDLSPSFLHTTWTIYEEMILLCLQQGQAEKAFSYLERARSLTLRQYLNRVKLPSHKEEVGSVAVSKEVLRTQMELKDWQESHRYYSRLLAEFDSSVSPTLDRTIVENELKQCEAKLNELFERLYLQQVAIDRDEEQARSRKRTRAKERLFIARTFDPVWLRQHLTEEQLLLTYYLHKEKLIIFALTPERMVTYEQPDGGRRLEQLLPLLHAHLQAGSRIDARNPSQQAMRRLLQKLYALLIAPVRTLLPPGEGQITIVPYGLLHKLPFHALYDGSHFLIEDYQVSYLPASSLLPQFSESSSEQSRQSEIALKPPLVFGYSERGQLPRVLDEVQVVTSLLGGTCYLEQDATIANLVQQAALVPILHIATHGHSRLEAPNFSYLRLADGQFITFDAFGLNLAGCELVTLSGCETGLALSSGGDEQIGLGRAFLAAGARSAVMSLWSVEDNATSELMQRFYQHLLQGKSKVQALRAAQCSFVRHSEPTYTHPYFWAAFRLVGDTGPLQYRH
jgi:CHAT domain-containing protein